MIQKKIVSVGDRKWVIPESDGEHPFFCMIDEIFIKKEYDCDLCPIDAGSIVLDVGANVGIFTIYCMEKGIEKVVAFEPGSSFSSMEENTKIYGDKVVPINAAAWNCITTLPFIDRLDATVVSMIQRWPSDDSLVQVNAVTIDSIVSDLKLDRVDFIKMDIEGAELEALDGARNTIKSFKPKMAICLYHTPEHKTQIPELVLDMVKSYQFTPIAHKRPYNTHDIGYFY